MVERHNRSGSVTEVAVSGIDLNNTNQRTTNATTTNQHNSDSNPNERYQINVNYAGKRSNDDLDTEFGLNVFCVCV